MIVPEYKLQEWTCCPLFEQEPYLPLVEACALKLARWTLLEAFDGRIVPVPVQRKKFTHFWNDDFGDKPTKVGDPRYEEYWSGARAARTVAKCLFDLINVYEVLRPVQPYKLDLGEHAIEGRYAVVRRRDRRAVNRMPLVLVLHPARVKYNTYPELLELARVCHYLRESEDLVIGTYHLSLISEKNWACQRPEINEPLGRQWLRAILESMAQSHQYVNRGSHCVQCISRRCLGAFRV